MSDITHEELPQRHLEGYFKIKPRGLEVNGELLLTLLEDFDGQNIKMTISLDNKP